MRLFQRGRRSKADKEGSEASGRGASWSDGSNGPEIPDSSRGELTEREVRMNARRVRIRMLVAAGRIDEIADLPELKETDGVEGAARRSNPHTLRKVPRTQQLRSRTAHEIPDNGEVVLSPDDIQWLIAGHGLFITVSGYESLIIRAGLGTVRPAVVPAPQRRPSHKVRIAAAKVRVESDRQVHRATPEWIKNLANSGPPDAPGETAPGGNSSTRWLGRWWRSRSALPRCNP